MNGGNRYRQDTASYPLLAPWLSHLRGGRNVQAIMPCLEPPYKIQKFKNLTIEKKNISLVQLTNAAISLLNS